MLIVLLTTVVANGPAANSGMYVDLFWNVWLGCWLFSVLSMAIGTFMNSNGVAIAVAIVLNVAGVVITGVIYENVSQTLAKGFFPVVVGVVLDRQGTGGDEGTFSLALSSVILVLWLVALVGAAWARVQRAEY
jgi:hypothetical protein